MGSLAYDLLYQVRSPSIVTYFVRNQTPRPRTRHARASTSRLVQNLESSVLPLYPFSWAASGRLARPWTGTPNPWKRRSNPEKIRTRVGTGDGCPHITFATPVALTSIEYKDPIAPDSPSGAISLALATTPRREARPDR